MSNCSLCGENISAWSQVKINGGCICKNCAKKIPSVIKPKELTESRIKEFLEYEENPLFQEFSATASYGKLHIDEMHGLFAVSDKVNSEGKPEDPNVFYVLDLSQVGLYCIDPRMFRGSVVVDIKFNCTIHPLRLDFEQTIRQQVACTSKRIDSSHLDWNEPGDFAMFRSMFNQMIQNENDKLKRQYAHNFMSKEDLDIFKAKCLFMLDDDFTKEELRSQRNTMIKAFHTDVSDHSAMYSQKINEAYRILLPLAIS